ncbi:Nif3-like dinuclear metal center hexameric protein [Planctomycetota bacterium]|nr:Nif3-like dinuclear metal center hexameric protein [Planctomycetota bacterium]
MKLQQVLSVLQSIAPEHLAESWDKVGLHVENTANIKKALLCIDLTQSVMAEAISQKVNMIVAYHPPIFAPLTALTSNDYKQNIILTAARKNIAIYSPHTALDASPTGVNQFLAEGIAADDKAVIKPIRPHVSNPEQYKLVVFVPEKEVLKLRSVLSATGAGVIGEYSECSYAVSGQGTFRGNDSTNPSIGTAGQFETVNELRLEMIVPKSKLGSVIAALRDTHSYEEPAFDIYPLISDPTPNSDDMTGQGRIVELAKPISLKTLTARIKKLLKLKYLEVAPAEGSTLAAKNIQRIGLCAGAGQSLMSEVGPMDAFFTGEMRHHDMLAAISDGVAVLLAGHTRTERPFLRDYRAQIRKAGAGEVEWLISKADCSPGEYV